MSDEDYSNLPVSERLGHKVWKVRLGAYEEIAREFEKSRSEHDECFGAYGDPHLYKKIVTDANVVAQETGIAALNAYLQYGGLPNVVNKLKNAGVVGALCEKGLSSSRAGTKAKAIDALLWFVEYAGDAGAIVEDILPFLSHRLPKLVSGCVGALAQIIDNFGCGVVPPKIIIPSLAKLFGHADRNVRAETTKLTVELYKWMGDGLSTVLFPDLKPVQQKDLTAAFDKVKGEAPQQKRLTKAQQAETATEQPDDEGDVEMTDVIAPQVDPFDLLEPVDVVSKFPGDLSSRMASSKWKDRVEALEEVHEVLAKTPKIKPDDFTEFMRILAKVFSKDANVQVVQIGAECVTYLAHGLKKDFRYHALVVTPLIERLKEKKPSVADALNGALDAVFDIVGLSDILEPALAGTKHKTPQVKIASTKYLQRCLANTKKAPSSQEVDSIITSGVKLLSESQEPVRQAATELIGTLMKITGERELNPFLDKIDDIRKTKVRAFYDAVEVKAKPASAPAPKRNTSIPSRKVAAAPPRPSALIPSKRTATSPAKRLDEKKVPGGRSLTGRLLLSPTQPLAPAAPSIDVAALKADADELRALREEKQQWLTQKEHFLQSQEKYQSQQAKHAQEIDAITQQWDATKRALNNAELMNSQKETQIVRLQSELENSKLYVRDLEQKIEMMKLKHKQAEERPFSPERHTSQFTSGELSSRVNRLLIDGDTAQPSRVSYTRLSPQRSEYREPHKDFVADDESWRRAAEVTSQLKARIEKMKARSRSVNSGL